MIEDYKTEELFIELTERIMLENIIDFLFDYYGEDEVIKAMYGNT